MARSGAAGSLDVRLRPGVFHAGVSMGKPWTRAASLFPANVDDAPQQLQRLAPGALAFILFTRKRKRFAFVASSVGEKWPPPLGQPGGFAKVESGVGYAASWWGDQPGASPGLVGASSWHASSGVRPFRLEWGRDAL